MTIKKQTNKQTNRKQTVEAFRPSLKKKKKRFQYASRVTFFLRFEGLSLGLRYRQTKKALVKYFVIEKHKFI